MTGMRVLRLLNGVLCSVWMYVGVLWLESVARTWPDAAFSNCWIRATQEKQRRGGYLIVRDSRYGTWWHAQWSDGTTVGEFNPPSKHRRRVPPALFHGTWREWQD